MKEKMIMVNKASVLYENHKWGMKNFSLDFYGGEFISLIGANGSGKTTFINALCGFLPLTEGEIYYNSSVINASKPFEKIGWTNQTNAIDWYLNVEDNVKIGVELLKINNLKKQQLVDKSLKIVDLYDKKNVSVDELSGGQQQRVQIARALVHEPDILILDEPTTGLDPKIAESVIKHLYNLSRKGCLVIVSSHDLSLIEKYCDKILLLQNSRVIAFENRELFMNDFNDRKIVEITYTGTITEDIIKKLPSNFQLISKQPLKIDVPRNTTLDTIVNLLDNKVNIIDFNQSSPGLREVYLKFSEKE